MLRLFEFQSTLLIRGATSAAPFAPKTSAVFQSTLLIRGATLYFPGQIIRGVEHFNPRSSYEERRFGVFGYIIQFYFNPRSSYEERHSATVFPLFVSLFQSTLLIRGATSCALQSSHTLTGFQSTLLIRGATRPHPVIAPAIRISIHAPHTRSDCFSRSISSRRFYFNPRSSYEERPSLCLQN